MTGAEDGPRRASIADVAAHAGVSQGTVSNVMNHPERVAARTRERVERAIAELDFTPHGPARSLAAGSIPALGLILSDLSNSLFVDISRGVERVAAEHRTFVLMANTDTDLERERRYLDAFASTQTLGTLLTINDASHYRALVEGYRAGRPLVFLNYRGQGDTHCCVHTDNREGGRIAARHLVETGRRRLALVGAPMWLQPVSERVEGFQEEARALGATIVAHEEAGELNRAYGWSAGRALLSRVERGEIDGVFAVADLLAAGIAQALSGAGVRIPEDVAIVGYDDNRAAWDSPLPLTTIRQPGEGMGAAGADLVFEELHDPNHEHRVVPLGPSLVVRRSTVAGV
ncbi:LacI family DNA-binding transcriptional regulator [Demequina capsici]|uniref:LacI family DNA-binding transcriptional regulator n=1 Tax=Demequina capsici TaxID=3075620 RepID=A0AA96JCP2_9MICO|nr:MULTISPECIES: LacI family DNA-binding transcriptional regulator [unclassified Demequina]WNM23834.1 LacI family DNA-binding transcriptional regulator [Demequina sp. OYTSA14]WNM26673.1 LacI family DNA-binding transcriptional regulator [Demequina sp. PMTSA13]